MGDELARARRALRAVDAELSVTWGDVLDGAAVEHIAAGGVHAPGETAPVLPLGVGRGRRPGVVAVAAASALVVVLGLGAGLLAARQPADGTPPAASGAPVVGPGPTAVPSTAEPDAAQVLVDVTRQARTEAAPCVVILSSKVPKAVVVVTDGDLTPVRVLLGSTWTGWTDDGTRVRVDDRTQTWSAVSGHDDLLADEPELAAAAAALRLLTVDGDQAWSLSGEGAAPGLSTVVDTAGGAFRVDVALDADSGLPSQVLTRGGAALSVSWLTCDEKGSDRLLTVEVPDTYARVPGAEGGTG